MHHSPRGYTLLELIVSLGIFSFVMLAVTGAYLTLISLDREARANSQLAASLSFAVESMARSIRTGTAYDAGPSSPSCAAGGSSTLSFINSESQEVEYLLKSTDGTIGQCDGTAACTDATASPLTDPRIQITGLCFYVRGETPSDIYQPQVTFTITGEIQTDVGKTSFFAIQGGATQRIIDL